VVRDWYAQRGYDFVVFTDHNHVTVIDSTPLLLVLPGVELTQNLRQCDPPGPSPCLVHVNALVVDPASAGPVELSPDGANHERMFTAAIARAAQLGGLAQVNHPNFHYSADGEVIARLVGRGARLLEVANEAVDSNNEGDASHPSTEALWDAVLTRGERVWATATDDAHHYLDAQAVRTRGDIAYVGDRGFVQVLARRSAASIRAALEAGSFYASNGVELTSVERADGVLRVRIASTLPPHDFRCVGRGGSVIGTSRGHHTECRVTEGYVRAVVIDPEGRKALTQPVFAPR
jgi:hypothetical protein